VLCGRLLPLLIGTLIASEDSCDEEHKAIIFPSYLIDLGRRRKDKLVSRIYRNLPQLLTLLSLVGIALTSLKA
jgi:hypothetical protein